MHCKLECAGLVVCITAMINHLHIFIRSSNKWSLIYVWIYENGVEKLNSRLKRAFFSRQKLSPKSTIWKLKAKSVLFSFPLPVYLHFITFLSPLFARFPGLKKAFKFSEIKVQLISRPKRAFFFSPEAISKVDNIKIKSKVSAFFLPLPVYLPFIALLSLLFARF